MRKILFGIILAIFLAGCVQDDVPPSPPAPGSDTDIKTGFAFLSSTPADTRFAPPRDIFEDEDLFTLDLDSGGVLPIQSGSATVNLDIEVNHDGGFIWNKVYVADTVHNSWIEYTLSGDTYSGTGYLKTTDVSKQLTINTSKLEEGSGYVLAYTCKKRSETWKCGCRSNTDCNKWMLNEFNVLEVPPGPGGISGYTYEFEAGNQYLISFPLNPTDPTIAGVFGDSLTGGTSSANADHFRIWNETTTSYTPDIFYYSGAPIGQDGHFFEEGSSNLADTISLDGTIFLFEPVADGSFTIAGTPISEPQTVTIKYLTFFGVPGCSEYYPASRVLFELHSKDAKCTSFNRVDPITGGHIGVSINTNGQIIGDDFDLQSSEGYFVLCDATTDFEWTPTCEDAEPQLGTADYPYLISDCEGLQKMKNGLGAYYELTEDIDCTETRTWDDGKGFSPIGGIFSGILDGRGYSISNLYLNRPSSNDASTFSKANSSASVKNIAFVAVNYTGNVDVAAVYAENEGGSVENVSVSGSFYALSGRAAGIAGHNAGLIENVAVNAVIRSDWNSGYAGGIAAFSSGTIRNSYSVGLVNAPGTYKGGLVGDNRGTIENSFSDSNVTVGGVSGGLAGLHMGVMANSFWNNNSNNPDVCMGDDRGTTSCAAIANDSTYFYNVTKEPMASWDFDTIWQENAGGYPTLQVQ